jgi:hypothetical protein
MREEAMWTGALREKDIMKVDTYRRTLWSMT